MQRKHASRKSFGSTTSRSHSLTHMPLSRYIIYDYDGIVCTTCGNPMTYWALVCCATINSKSKKNLDDEFDNIFLLNFLSFLFLLLFFFLFCEILWRLDFWVVVFMYAGHIYASLTMNVVFGCRMPRLVTYCFSCSIQHESKSLLLQRIYSQHVYTKLSLLLLL